MKQTIWTELQASDCTIVNTDRGSIQIAHKELNRPLWFIQSRKGNYYWRDTGKASSPYAYAFIIKGQLS